MHPSNQAKPESGPEPLDPDFARWLEEQARPFDGGHEQWLTKFSQEFDDWCKDRQSGA
jgi:hypothetical protein